MVTTVHDMLKWYTSELFDKLKETQDQSSHNFMEQERVLKAYFEQMADMETGYANQVQRSQRDFPWVRLYGSNDM